MTAKQFSEAMGEMGDKYIGEAIQYKAARAPRQPVWFKWGAAAACLCLVVAGGVLLARSGSPAAPNPALVQVTNPIITVDSAQEMEEYLDFKVPVLDKEVETYSVLVSEGTPTLGQIDYADGSEFRVQYGSGDISGIHGGTLVESKEVNGVTVHYYQFAAPDTAAPTTYATWEQNGFAFSYLYPSGNATDIEALIQQGR